MREIYKHMSSDQKKEAVRILTEDLKKLEQELAQNEDYFSSFIREILYSTRDKWNLEIDELKLELKNENN